MALTIEDCQAMAAAIAETGVFLMPAFKMRYYPLIQKARAFIPAPQVLVGQMMDARWADAMWAQDPIQGGANVFSQGCHAACRPGAPMPSSLVNKIRIGLEFFSGVPRPCSGARRLQNSTPGSDPAPAGSAQTGSAAYQAYRILQLGFTVAPLAAGADKFAHLLTNWDQYLAPPINTLLGGHGHQFMQAVGVIEIIAGLGVAFKPRIFAYVVAAWLLGIVVNLLLSGHYFDIALRDFGLALGALALARLSQEFDRA